MARETISQNQDMGVIPQDSVDRIAPTLKPSRWPVMRQRWAHLLFLHWPVATDVLRPLIPAELEVDTFDGQAHVGLVPFTMTGVRPTWAPPVWGLSSFHEVNVRTYVHRAGRDPGVWFFSLDAANAIAVKIARGLWKLPYHYAKMNMGREAAPSGELGGVWRYQSRRLWPGPLPADCRIEYEIAGTPKAARVGTLEHFLAERYLLYTKTKTRLLCGQVHHSPYPLQAAVLHELDENLVAAAGISVSGRPPFTHYAEEVRVRVYALRSL